eukprot:11963-Chlamydomonas_euryale.AAC.3
MSPRPPPRWRCRLIPAPPSTLPRPPHDAPDPPGERSAISARSAASSQPAVPPPSRKWRRLAQAAPSRRAPWSARAAWACCCGAAWPRRGARPRDRAMSRSLPLPSEQASMCQPDAAGTTRDQRQPFNAESWAQRPRTQPQRAAATAACHRRRPAARAGGARLRRWRTALSRESAACLPGAESSAIFDPALGRGLSPPLTRHASSNAFGRRARRAGGVAVWDAVCGLGRQRELEMRDSVGEGS